MTTLPYDPYRACALCQACRTAPEGRQCVHPEVKPQPIENVRGKFGACGPEAHLAIANWARPS